MRKKTTTTFSVSSADSDDRMVASFKFESGDLKDEGRIDSDGELEYAISEPGQIRLSYINFLRPERDEHADKSCPRLHASGEPPLCQGRCRMNRATA